MILSPDDIKKLGTILSVWAHPDDESWCMAGVLAQAVANGQRVVCITATKGDAGMTSDESRWPQTNLGEIREKELEESLKIIGVDEHYWLDYDDGRLQESDSQPAVTQISEIIKEVHPDSVFSFGSDGLTGHTDHIAVYEWTKSALKKADSDSSLYVVAEISEFYESAANRSADEKFNIYFNTAKPKTLPIKDIDLVFKLPTEIQAKKLASLKSHASQVERFITDSDGKAFMVELSKCEAFMKDKQKSTNL
jgi:LmbE family N-acetylglucosaminyl deacetylase